MNSSAYPLGMIAIKAISSSSFKQASVTDRIYSEIEHPYRSYWAHRLGGAVGGGLVGALAGSGGAGNGRLVGALAGAFVGEKGGEIRSLMNHQRAVLDFEEMGQQLPDAVKHPHIYGPEAHHVALKKMNQPPVFPLLPPGGI